MEQWRQGSMSNGRIKYARDNNGAHPPRWFPDSLQEKGMTAARRRVQLILYDCMFDEYTHNTTYGMVGDLGLFSPNNVTRNSPLYARYSCPFFLDNLLLDNFSTN